MAQLVQRVQEAYGAIHLLVLNAGGAGGRLANGSAGWPTLPDTCRPGAASCRGYCAAPPSPRPCSCCLACMRHALQPPTRCTCTAAPCCCRAQFLRRHCGQRPGGHAAGTGDKLLGACCAPPRRSCPRMVSSWAGLEGCLGPRRSRAERALQGTLSTAAGVARKSGQTAEETHPLPPPAGAGYARAGDRLSAVVLRQRREPPLPHLQSGPGQAAGDLGGKRKSPYAARAEPVPMWHGQLPCFARAHPAGLRFLLLGLPLPPKEPPLARPATPPPTPHSS